MELEIWVIALLCSAYFAAGFIDSIAGGGGLISVPAFLLTGTPPEVVLGTNKLASCCGMATALRNYARSGLVVWRAAWVGVPVVLVGAALGAKALLFFDSEAVGKIIVALLPLGILATFMPKKDQGKHQDITPRGLYVHLPIICLILGFYEGFFGPGAGSFFILAQHFILRFGLLQASATTKLLNLGAGLSAVVVLMWHGKVLYLLALPLAAANICGNYMGSKLAIRIGAAFVRRLLSVSLSLLFISLIWKFWIGK